MFRDRNGKISRKAVAAYFLLINAVAMMWTAMFTGLSSSLPVFITLITSATALLTATVVEKQNVQQ